MQGSYQYPLANVELTPAGRWSLDWIEDPERTSLSVTSITENRVAFITENLDKREYRFVGTDGSLQETGNLPDAERRIAPVPAETYVVPPGLVAGLATVSSLIDPGAPTAWPDSVATWMLVALHSLVSAIGTFFLVRMRVSSPRSQLIWILFAAFAGIGTWLAVISVYPRAVYEPCTGCERRRRIDRDRCENCGVEWPLPDSEGIALMGPRLRDQVLVEQASV